jgi:hypothetical protein
MNNPATIPNIVRTPKGLPTVKWCIETLKWAGWQYEGMEPAYDGDTGLTHRLYWFTDPNGKKHGLAAWGLRDEAEQAWMNAQIAAASLLTTRTP